MQIELRIDGYHHGSVGYFKYHHYTDDTEQGEIWLHGVLCGICGQHLLDADDYYDILEHEYIELLASRIDFMDNGCRKWNAGGFNNMIYLNIPSKCAFHIHDYNPTGIPCFGISEVNYMGALP